MNLTVADCVQAIGESAHAWKGRCHEIAARIHAAGLVAGRVVYGHWRGPISPRSHFASYRSLPFVHHGWIVTDEDSGTVFDPTRWVFEAVRPYLFVGEPPDQIAACCRACDHTIDEHEHGRFFNKCEICDCLDYVAPLPWPYDEGGDVWRLMTEQPMPKAEPGVKSVSLGLSPEVRRRLGIPSRMTEGQVFWLANLSYATLGDDAPTVYDALAKSGRGALIPFDNLNRAKASRSRDRLTG